MKALCLINKISNTKTWDEKKYVVYNYKTDIGLFVRFNHIRSRTLLECRPGEEIH